MKNLNHQAYLDNLAVVSKFTPSLLWQWFARIASIPHPSDYEENLAQFIVDWAKGRGLSVRRDGVGNVIIVKKASEGMQNRKAVALQAHLDMVPQANGGTKHDFTCDPLRLRVSDDGEWLLASDTTLGADNGIGMASCLALLQSDVPHGELQVLLTMTEETGMVGAKGLAAGELTADLMINTDTEEIGEIYIGCAGGIDADVRLQLQRGADFDAAIAIELTGLRGGHSGLDIHKNRGNAIKLQATALAALQQKYADKFAIIDFAGGTLRNAIAREAQVVIACDADDVAVFCATLQTIFGELQAQFADSEPNFQVHITPSKMPQPPLSVASSQQLIALVDALPNGVLAMSDDIADTVQTSLSLGKAGVENDAFAATILLRSLSEIDKQKACEQLSAVVTAQGGSVQFSGDYNGWQPQADSPFVAQAADLYAKILGKSPQIKVIHAGLECGLIKKNYPDMDIISIGPTIKNAHSPAEKVHIGSVATYWQLLVDILANVPER